MGRAETICWSSGVQYAEDAALSLPKRDYYDGGGVRCPALRHTYIMLFFPGRKHWMYAVVPKKNIESNMCVREKRVAILQEV